MEPHQHRTSGISTQHLADALSEYDRLFLEHIEREYRPTFQQMRMLTELAIDLRVWRERPLQEFWIDEAGGTRVGRPRLKAIINDLMSRIGTLRSEGTDYSTFTAKPEYSSKATHVEELGPIKLLGRCPCPVSGEKTRCCNLLTLDVVQQCAFACSYCSIQSFYHKNEIIFAANLSERLEQLELPEGAWHIGTGQSSDSLMWGNDHGVLDALVQFSHRHPQIVIELKTKSARTDWIDLAHLTRSMVATWSLNAPTIIAKEEHGTVSLQSRLDAARKAADAGIMVGFHLHPMVHFSHWEEEYRFVIEQITERFSSEEVLMLSLGTLTFTKEAIRELRKSGRPSRVLQMELTQVAGKFSYPDQIKQRLFSHAFSCFPDSWKTPDGPFFYLCMEPPHLWEPVFGFSYPSNADFEIAMREHYRKKLNVMQ